MRTSLLEEKASVIVTPKSPYNFDATVFKPAHYPDPLKVYETGKYWFALILNKKTYGVKMENLGKTDKPKVKITIFYKNRLPEKEFNAVV